MAKKIRMAEPQKYNCTELKTGLKQHRYEKQYVPLWMQSILFITNNNNYFCTFY